MRPFNRAVLVSATLFGLLTASVAVVKGESRPRQGVADRSIKDDGEFFSDDARKKANQAIEEIHKRHGIDLKIETFKKITPEGKDDRERSQFFARWVRDRARELKVHGI